MTDNAKPEPRPGAIWYCLKCGKAGHTLAEVRAHGGEA